MQKMRVHILARALGITSKEIVLRCQAEGIDVIKNHMSTLSSGLEAAIRTWFSDPEKPSEPREARRVAFAQSALIPRSQAKLIGSRLAQNEDPNDDVASTSPNGTASSAAVRIQSTGQRKTDPFSSISVRGDISGDLTTALPEELLEQAEHHIAQGSYRAAFEATVASLEAKLKRSFSKGGYKVKIRMLIDELPIDGPLGDQLLRKHLHQYWTIRNKTTHEALIASKYQASLAVFTVRYLFAHLEGHE